MLSASINCTKGYETLDSPMKGMRQRVVRVNNNIITVLMCPFNFNQMHVHTVILVRP